jgi:hypothetical protein
MERKAERDAKGVNVRIIFLTDTAKQAGREGEEEQLSETYLLMSD